MTTKKHIMTTKIHKMTTKMAAMSVSVGGSCSNVGGAGGFYMPTCIRQGCGVDITFTDLLLLLLGDQKTIETDCGCLKKDACLILEIKPCCDLIICV